MKFKLTGLKNVEEKLNEMINQVDDIAEDALGEIASNIYARSQQMVPVDTGRLKDSGEIVRISELHWAVQYQAFDPKTGYEYAPIQHEHLGFNHTVGNAKYLELAVDVGEIQSVLKKHFG